MNLKQASGDGGRKNILKRHAEETLKETRPKIKPINLHLSGITWCDYKLTFRTVRFRGRILNKIEIHYSFNKSIKLQS